MTSHRSAIGTTAAPKASPADAVSISLEESLRPVLESMLVGLRRHRETPLLAGFDSQALALAALNSCSIDVSPFDDAGWTEVARALDALIQQCLPQEFLSPNARELPNVESTENRACRSPETNGLHPVAIWLEQFHDVLRKVHPKGIELVALRLAGLDSRETARHLDLPHRLCQQVARDVAQAWAAAMEVR